MTEQDQDRAATAIVACMIVQGAESAIFWRLVSELWPNELYFPGLILSIIGLFGLISKLGGFND